MPSQIPSWAIAMIRRSFTRVNPNPNKSSEPSQHVRAIRNRLIVFALGIIVGGFAIAFFQGAAVATGGGPIDTNPGGGPGTGTGGSGGGGAAKSDSFRPP